METAHDSLGKTAPHALPLSVDEDVFAATLDAERNVIFIPSTQGDIVIRALTTFDSNRLRALLAGRSLQFMGDPDALFYQLIKGSIGRAVELGRNRFYVIDKGIPELRVA